LGVEVENHIGVSVSIDILQSVAAHAALH
jgi:hypothetical protein